MSALLKIVGSVSIEVVVAYAMANSGLMTLWIFPIYFAKGIIYVLNTDNLSSNGYSFTTISLVMSPFSHTYDMIVIRNSSCSLLRTAPDKTLLNLSTASYLSTPMTDLMNIATFGPQDMPAVYLS